ncbi:MAG: M14 family zinc carboxypeptidase [Gemmatimonadaceae bacterium]
MRRHIPPAAVARAVAVLAAAGACAGGGGGSGGPSPAGAGRPQPAAAGRAATQTGVYRVDVQRVRPLTRAERSRFAETSTYDDVRRFLDSLRTLGAKMSVGSIGRTGEGREIPYVVASRPVVATPAEARRLHRPIVYVQANIHAGEVEGKEALQALLRDLLFQDQYNVLDSIVLVAVPIYNADGNERFGPQERNRPSQNGPPLVGQRANADSLDLNRDYVKAEAPETRASLAMFAAWEPDVFVDLHTTNGSYHGYALTYSPSLSPAALVTAPFTRDTLLPELRRRMRLVHRTEVFDYGNFVSQDSVDRGWFTYDHRPRFGTNYMGLRGRIAVLSEAYSHDRFARRVGATYAFVYELLSLVAENGDDILDLSNEADRRATGWGTLPESSPSLPIRASLPARPARREPVLVEQLERLADTSLVTEVGVPRGVRRTGRIRAVTMPVHDRFTPTLGRRLPHAYALGPEHEAAARALRLHGVVVERLGADLAARVERFTLDSVVRAPRAFQRHLEVRVEGRWSPEARTLPAGTILVRTGQPLSILAAYLLEPGSDDGLTTWNFFDSALRPGGSHPVVRVTQPVAGGVVPF